MTPHPLERVHCLTGDITAQEVDAVVNAANEQLLPGGGVAGAIHRAAGPGLVEECRRLYPEGCPPGGARRTGGHGLPATCVLHTVGPVYVDGRHEEPRLLASCYLRTLDLAAENGLRTVAFPALSTGAFGYPAREAAGVAMQALAEGLREHPEIGEVRMVLFDDDMRALFEDARRRAMA